MFGSISKIFNNKKNIIGLDIGTSSIKLIEVSGDSLDGLELSSYAIVSVPRDLIAENGDFKEEEAGKLSELINKCWEKAGCSSKNVAIAINSSNVIVKTIEIPRFQDSTELKMAVENEFMKYIPEEISLSDLSLDYFYTGNQIDDDLEEMFVVACKKEKIEFLQAVVEGAGLTPEIADIENFAIENLLKLMKGMPFYEGTYVLADCSGAMLRMYAYVDGILTATKESQIGGMTLTSDLMNNLGVSYEDAEKIKHERNGDETFEMIEKNFIENYKNEFMSVLSYFVSANSLNKIDDIILTGGVAGLPNFEQIITNGILENQEQGIIVVNEPYIANPLENAAKSKKINIEKFKKDEQNLFLATSLAVRQYLRDY